MGQHHRWVSVSGLLGCFFAATAAAWGQAPGLIYHFQKGTKLVYDVRVEVDTADGKQVRSGAITYEVVDADDLGFALRQTGTLSDPAVAQARLNQPHVYYLHSRHGGLYRTYPGTAPATRPADPAETRFERNGELSVASAANRNFHILADLPILPIEPLSDGGKNEWELHREMPMQWATTTAVLMNVSGGGVGGSDASVKIYPTEQVTHCKLRGRGGKTLVIERGYVTRTKDQVNGQSFIELTGASETIYDAATMEPQRIEFGGKLTVRTVQNTVTLPVHLLVRRESDADVNKHAADAAASRAKMQKNAADFRTKSQQSSQIMMDFMRVNEVPEDQRPPLDLAVLKDLRSNDVDTVTQALLTVAHARPDAKQKAQVLAALSRVVTYGPGRQHMVSYLRYTRTPWQNAMPPRTTPLSETEVRTLAAKLAAAEFPDAKKPILRELGQSKNPRAIAAVATQLSDPFVHTQAIAALSQQGPAGAAALAGALQTTTDFFTRKDLLKGLAQCGTRKELPAVQALTHDSNSMLREAAVATAAAIQARN